MAPSVSSPPAVVLRFSSAGTVWGAVKTYITGWFPQA